MTAMTHRLLLAGAFISLLLGAVLVSFPAPALGQGILISETDARLPRPEIIIIRPPVPVPPVPPVRPFPPVRPRPIPVMEYKISQIDVQANLTDQIAEVYVSQTFVNTGSTQIEASFAFPLPYEGAIDQLILMVDGKEYPAELMDAEKARSVYESIVRKNKDPALLEWIGTGMFRTSVFPIPAGAKRTVSLKYTQLCRKSDGLTDFLFPLATARYTTRPIENLTVRLRIESSSPLRNIYSPSQELKIEKPNDKTANVTWEQKNIVPGMDFRLLFDTGTETLTTKVISYRPQPVSGSKNDENEGYFLILANPEIRRSDEKPLPKTVFLVVDNSGSMSGKKIVQAREALKFVLNHLRDGDWFNIITFNSSVRLFKDKLQLCNETTRKEALVFTEGIYSGGGTALDQAATTALAQLKELPEGTGKDGDGKDQGQVRPTYVFFLTDGCPTVGERNEMKIVENVKKANSSKARVFTFGVGYDVNSRLLDKLGRQTGGLSEYVKPNEDIEESVSRLYNRLESPIMTNVELVFQPNDGSEANDKGIPMVNRVYPANGFDLFAGEQLVIAGRYRLPGKGTLRVKGMVTEGTDSEFTYPIELAEVSADSRFAFAEKLWALRRIGEIIDDIDLNGKQQELLDELVELSIRHGILTPYTSFLADENTQLTDQAVNSSRAFKRVDALSMNASGSSGFIQRGAKAKYQNAFNMADQSRAESMGFDALDSIAANEAIAPAAGSRGALQPAKAQRMPAVRQNMPDSGNTFAAGGNRKIGLNRMMADSPRQNLGRTVGGSTSNESLAASEQQSMQQNVRTINNRTFFYKNSQWNDSTLSTAQLNATPKIVKQFSDEYFDLVHKHGQNLTPYLAFDEPVLINIDNQAYLIQP